MQWDAWGAAEASKPLSAAVRSLLTQAFGVTVSDAPRPAEDSVVLRDSELPGEVADKLVAIVGGPLPPTGSPSAPMI